MEFRVLGSVEASMDGRIVELGHARQRSLLAVLLVEANRPVPTDRLIDCAWDTGRSTPGQDTLYSYLSRLRRALAPASDTVQLVRRSGGYLLEVDEDAVDLHRFRRLVQQARTSTPDDVATALLEDALGLWRAEAFSGLDSPWLTGLRVSLANERFAGQLDHADRALRAGRHDALLPVLSARAEAHPFDERVAGQLLLALYRCGRQADALSAYQRIRQRLSEELGTDPVPQLQQLHQQILRGDPSLDAAAGPDTAAGLDAAVVTEERVDGPTPRQLPASPGRFSGRTSELADITKRVYASDPGATPLVAISGAGGVGKTWVALRWAHQNSDRFPDGQVYVNLRGFDPTGEPLSTSAALRGFLDALGVAPAAMPVEVDAQVGLYRSLVAGRRMLIVLDNARDTGQVEYLLPGTSTCVVLVTSRDRLTGLVSGHGAQPLAVGMLTDAEARDLLVRWLGEERLAAEPEAVASLLAGCAGLPLALGIAAARAAVAPELELGAIAAELRDDSTRLGALDEEDAAASLRAVLAGSYRALDARQAQVFALLGCAVGPDVSAPAAAAVTGLSVEDVAVTLRRLERRSLLQPSGDGRWRMHDLVRLYATEQSDRMPAPERQAARLRLVDFFLHTCHTAALLIAAQRQPIALDEPASGSQPLTLADRAAASDWLDGEYPCLVAAQRLALEQGWYPAVWQLAWALQTFQHRRGYLHDRVAVWRIGAARGGGDGRAGAADPGTPGAGARVLGGRRARRRDRAAARGAVAGRGDRGQRAAGGQRAGAGAGVRAGRGRRVGAAAFGRGVRGVPGAGESGT